MSVEECKKASCNCSGNDDYPDATGETSCGCIQDKPEQGSKRNRGLNVVKAPRIYRERRSVRGEVVTVIDVTLASSDIDLIESWSRAVPRGEIHEIMIWSSTEERDDDAAAVAFIEITQGGNIVNGDEVKVDGELIGNLAGFDYNHMPNHMNVVIETKSLKFTIKLGSVFEFTPNPMLPLLDEEDCC